MDLDIHNIVKFRPNHLVYPNSWIGHIPFAGWVIQVVNPSIFVELGTHSGNSYLSFCQAVKEGKLQTSCYSVDTWKGDDHTGHYGEETFIRLNEYHNENYKDFSRLLKMTFDEAVQYFEDESIELLHIDGLHTYEAVKHDFETWLPKLAPHALVLFHDTNVQERDFGVWKFWNEIKQKYPLNFEFFHSNGLGIIQLSENLEISDLNFFNMCSENERQFRAFFESLALNIYDQYKLFERDEKILLLEKTKANLKSESISIQTKLNEKEQLYKELFKEKLAEQKIIQRNLERNFLDLETNLKKREQILQDLNSKLLEIYSSTAWKVVKKMWKVRLRFTPHNSTREKIAYAILEFPNKLIQKGKTETNVNINIQGIDDNDPKFDSFDNKSDLNITNQIGPQNFYNSLLKSSKGDKSPEFVDLSDTTDLSHVDLPIKLIAFYLPQYHPIPENDLWWGKGFTEWTNVSKAVPQFDGHYQPHLPGELGFYDLRVPDVQRRQVELARKFGIYGFCFYFYWFNGKRLLELPLENFITDSQIDFPFCLCWANENWTRRWDGLENEILIGQEHSLENDINFIKDVCKYFKHKNYIRIDNRPILIIYRVNDLINPIETAENWRDYSINHGFGNPFLIAAQTFDFYGDPRTVGFDACVEFPPFGSNLVNIHDQVDWINPTFNGNIYSYPEVMNSFIKKDDQSYCLFKTVMPSWDNTARKAELGSIYLNSSPFLYEKWLSSVTKSAIVKQNKCEKIVFINAWNEWGEGAYLEPDRKFGYSYLQSTANALKYVQTESTKSSKILFISHDANFGGAQKSLLSIISWLSERTKLDIKVLFLGDGILRNEFEFYSGTLLLPIDVENESNWIGKVLNFCGGKPDLIYANTVVSSSAFPLLKKLDVPILTHVRELESSIKKYSPEWNINYDYSDHFISVSEAVKKQLINNYLIDGKKISTIYNFLKENIDKPSSKEEKKELRLKLGLHLEKCLIVGCGIGMPFRKGIDLFYETVENLLSMGINDFHFYWIGGNFDNNDQNEFGISWKEKFLELSRGKITNYLTVLGKKDDVNLYLKAGDIFLLSSREEPFGRVVLEAADAGLPIILFADGGGSTEFVEDDAGLVVPNIDSRLMANKISLLINDDNLRLKLGLNAQNKLRTKFSSNIVMPMILSKIREVGKFPPYLSIILPNYNHAKFLPKRLESIFSQTFKDYELIIMDDFSSDESNTILMDYENKPDVIYIRNEQNSGSPFRQWLKAFSITKGQIIWIAESDDWSEITFLEKLIPAFDNPEVTLAYCASKIINEKNEVMGDYRDGEYLRSISETRWNTSYCIPGYQEVNEAMGIKNTIVNISSVLFRKQIFDKTFQETISKMHVGGDTYLLLYLLEHGKIYFEAESLNYHRRHSSSIIGKIFHDKNNDYLRLFFNDFYLNHKYVIDKYSLDSYFYKKLDCYIHELWKAVAPNEPFENIQNFINYDDLLKDK